MPAKPSAVIDTRVIYCGEQRDVASNQLRKLPGAASISAFQLSALSFWMQIWGETKEKRSFEDRHESTKAYIDYMRPRCVELQRVLKKTGSFYYHCDWHASHYVKVIAQQA